MNCEHLVICNIQVKNEQTKKHSLVVFLLWRLDFKLLTWFYLFLCNKHEFTRLVFSSMLHTRVSNKLTGPQTQSLWSSWRWGAFSSWSVCWPCEPWGCQAPCLWSCPAPLCQCPTVMRTRPRGPLHLCLLAKPRKRVNEILCWDFGVRLGVRWFLTTFRESMLFSLRQQTTPDTEWRPHICPTSQKPL